MKKIFSIAIITSIAFVSCKKSSIQGIGTSGIEATIGNTTTVFNVLAYAYPNKFRNSMNNMDTSYSYQIHAYSSASSSPYLNLSLSSNKPIVAGAVFSDTATIPDFSQVPIPYITNYLSIYFGHDNDPNNIFTGYKTLGVMSSPTTLTITTISNTSISGIFQGNLYSNDSAEIKQTINGKFIAPIVIYNY